MPWGEIAMFVALVGPFVTWRIARRGWNREDKKADQSQAAQSLETLLSSQREFADQLRGEIGELRTELLAEQVKRQELLDRLRVCEQECDDAKRQARASVHTVRQVTEEREILAEMANSVIWKIAHLMAPEHDRDPPQLSPGDSPVV